MGKAKEGMPNGRPREYGERQTFTLALPLETVAWLDGLAKKSGMSRNRVIQLQLDLVALLISFGYVAFNDEESGTISFRPIPNPELLQEQIRTGQIMKLLDRLPRNTLTVGFDLKRCAVPA